MQIVFLSMAHFPFWNGFRQARLFFESLAIFIQSLYVNVSALDKHSALTALTLPSKPQPNSAGFPKATRFAV
jgi:hypothetical protein